jgi:hypothetical protein
VPDGYGNTAPEKITINFEKAAKANNPAKWRFQIRRRRLGCDEDNERFEKKLGKTARITPNAE